MKNKLTVICICACLSSCINSNNQQNQEGVLNPSDSVVEELGNNQIPDIQNDTTKEEVPMVLIEEISNYGATISYYEWYIGTAYDKESHKKYFETKEQYKLDSLIRIYRNATQHYRDYGGLAYDRNVYYKYFETKEQYKLDSLIEIYNQNKAKNDDSLMNEQIEQYEEGIYEK